MVVEKLKRRFLARLKPNSLSRKEDQEGAATGGSHTPAGTAITYIGGTGYKQEGKLH